MAEFKLQLDPIEKIVFNGKKLGEEAAATSIKITNSLKDRISYKVKCTSNEMFRIRPPVGALKPGESVTVNLVFNAGKAVPDSGKHYFAIYYIKGADEKKAPRALWSDKKKKKKINIYIYEFTELGSAQETEDLVAFNNLLLDDISLYKI
uniref:Major sperm protein n=1 Tax=Heterorhabditis bacteriophora TaxID=37862 RepID=A0A1I7XBV6_HETBA